MNSLFFLEEWFGWKIFLFHSFVYHKIDEKKLKQSFPMRIFVSESHNLIIRFSSIFLVPELSGGGNLGRFLVFNLILIVGLKILQQSRSLHKISHYGFSLHKLTSHSVWISNKDKFSIGSIRENGIHFLDDCFQMHPNVCWLEVQSLKVILAPISNF